MKLYQEVSKEFPHIEMATHYAKVDSANATYVCVYNFYSQVLPKETIPCDVHLFAFNLKGNQIGYKKIFLANQGFLQINLKDHFENFEGLVGVMLVPQASFTELSSKLKNIKQNLGSGFYIIWEHDGYMDTMHEWFSFSKTPPVSSNHYLILNHNPDIQHGVIITNPSVTEIKPFDIELYDSKRKKLSKVRVNSIPSLATLKINFKDLFAEFETWVAQYKKLGIKIKGNLSCPPFTTENHRKGDFHIHHIN